MILLPHATNVTAELFISLAASTAFLWLLFQSFAAMAGALLIAWKWGVGSALAHLSEGSSFCPKSSRFLKTYFSICIKYIAPIAIALIFLQALNLF